MCSCSPFHIPLSSPEHQGIHFRDVAIILPGILFSFDFLLYDFWLFIPLYYFYQLDDQVMKSTTFLQHGTLQEQQMHLLKKTWGSSRLREDLQVYGDDL